ncbi:hemorrhagic metalloproteinase-disintegrin-like kaouthiagin isoform X1 [Haliotis rufescens]|uniref:hemorrhagic metalloproteinase-disintegrin-like kaouthiagin isoform X1 n=1 Tax=Haliotis rufescens TaxID=6454 RepID=UPI00201F6F7A|nr:hemorrhagic metalloproteinase-disintegrin-like kaouthiagin isoform X1 [Haliotis rufescens]
MKTLNMDILHVWMSCLLIGSLCMLVCAGKNANMQVDERTIRENPNCLTLSEELHVALESDGVTSTLTLIKNKNAGVNAPVYTSNKGGETQSLNLIDITNVDMYLDVTNMASMKVTCFAPHNESVQFIFEGTLAFGDKEWVLKPNTGNIFSSPVQYDMELYQLPDFGGDFKVRPLTGKTDDTSTPTPNGVPKPTAPTRSKRDVPAYIVDLLAVIDYSIYKEYYDKSAMGTDALKREDALAEIRKYFAHIVNGIALRYADIEIDPPIDVRLIGYFVAEDEVTAVWTEPYKAYDRTNFLYHVDADLSLDRLKQWRMETTLPVNDHAMLFTRYSLSYLDSGTVNLGVVGYAFVGSTCTDDSVSVIEESTDRFAGTSATAAHELGHNLGAEHDGTNNICWKDEKFLMWPSLTSVNVFHVWEFSHCSVAYFKHHLGNLVDTAAGFKCLSEAAEPTDVFDVAGKRHGQELTIAEQCELGLGAGSTICYSLTPLDTLCGGLYCEIPGYPGYCQPIYPALGTQCGSGKWCQGGQCVATDDASITSDRCPLGETADVYETGQNCSSYIGDYGTTSCYSIESLCCSTCRDLSTGVTGCEYGDRYVWCEERFCDPSLNETMNDGTLYQVVCCQTCGLTGDLYLDENAAVSLMDRGMLHTCTSVLLVTLLFQLIFMH